MKELGHALERLAAQLRAHRIVRNDGDASKAIKIWLACAEVMTIRMPEALTKEAPKKARDIDQTHFRQFGFGTPGILNSYETAGGLYHYTGTWTSGSAAEAVGAGPSGVTRAGGRTPAAAKAW